MSSSITARPSAVVSSRLRALLPTSMVLLVAACDPLSCQGAVVAQDRIVVEDVAVVGPKCRDNVVTFNGDIDVKNQEELASITGCTTVNGSIFIHDSVDIVDLSALAGLVNVNGGYILAINNSALADMSLPALTKLENGFAAIDNPALTKVIVPELPLLGGDLTLRNSPLLNQIDFSKIQRVDNADFIIDGQAFDAVTFGNVILADLPALTSITGAFDALEIIEGFLDVHGTGLKNFDGLQTLREILNGGGEKTPRTVFRNDKLNPGLIVGIDFNDKFNIVPAGNPALEDFKGLDNLEVIGSLNEDDIFTGGDVFIGFNPALKNLVGLEGLTEITGNVFIAGNDSLVDFSGLDSDNDNAGLSVINGSLIVGLFFDRLNQPVAAGNDSLENFTGLEDFTTLTGDLVLAFNGAFEDFSGLALLTAIGGDLVILGSEPDSLGGALALTTIGGDLSFGQFFGNDGQPMDPNELDVTRQFLDVDGVKQNPAVKFNPDNGDNGFDALTTVGGDLVFAFSSFEDLRLSNPATANLTTVNGSLILYGNANPESLDGLQDITTLGGFVVNFAVDAFGDLQPFENQGLVDFSGVTVANIGAGGLHIGFNDDLDDGAFATFNDFGTVVGDVTLAGAVNEDDLGPTDLGGLNITTIGGDLTLCGIKNGDDRPQAADLGNLTALNSNAIANVGGDVFIGFCSNLTNTTFNVVTIGGVLEFTALDSLDVVNGMAQLTSVGSLNVHDLRGLETLALPGLATVNGNLEIVRNDSLDTIDFNLNAVGGTVRFAELAILPNLGGLAGLATVGGDLDLIDLPKPTTTNPLDTLGAVGGTLRLRRLDAIVNEAEAGGDQGLSFAGLNTVGSLEINQMNELEDLLGLQSLNTVTGSVLIINNERLETLAGLQGLTTIGRRLAINDNPLLALFEFDDDDGDRQPDVDDGDGIDEAEDDDDILEQGLLALNTLGEPVFDDGVLIGGSSGVIELRNNTVLDEAAFIEDVVGDIPGYDGLLFFCGNEGSVDIVDADDRLTGFTTCPVGPAG